MIKQHVFVNSEISTEELTQMVHNWNDFQVATVLESYLELSKRKLQTPSLLSVLSEIQLHKKLSEFCQANQFSKIEDFVESYKASQENTDTSDDDETPDEFGLCWV